MTKTLHVRIEPAEEANDRIRGKLERIDSGDPETIDGDRVLSVPDEQALERVLTGTNLELVRAAATHEPGSLRELARLLDRDIKNVSRATNRLAELGIVELVSDGRAKRPVVPYDEIEVVYPLRSDSAESTAPA